MVSTSSPEEVGALPLASLPGAPVWRRYVVLKIVEF